MTDFIDTLFELIADRKTNPTSGSYTNTLFDKGLPAITQKVGEEAVEVVIAALSQTDDRLIDEMADLVYHSLVLLAAKGLTPEDISARLAERHQPRE